MNTTLLIMAAGIGSRFGTGIKQLEPVDDAGHIIMDYSIHDAIEAGFNHVVFIIRKDIEKEFKEVIGDRIASICSSHNVTVDYAFQDINDIPGTLPEGRTKPWGTGQAVLSAKSVIKTPFIVINADDYYGKEGFKAVHEYLVNGGKSCMAGFVLKNTLSDNGGVTRGICKMDEENNLTEVVETKNIVKTATGAEADSVVVDVNSLVSMNMWGLTPDFLDVLEEGFKEFFEKEVPGNPLKAEYLIPIFIGELLEQGKMSVKVLKTNDTWYGMTYHEDVAAVKDSFKKMLENGVYKADLFSYLETTMKETIDLLGKILTNILTALYEPFGFSLFLSFLAMFFYLYAYEPIHAGKGWKNAIVTWYQKFKESVFFRKLFFLVFVTSLILFRTLLNRQLWMNPLSDVMGGWGIWETVNGEQKLTTECIENVIMMVPFSAVVLWTFGEKIGNDWKKILWQSGKIAFIFSISIEMLQLLLRLGTFQLSDIFYNTVGGVLGGLLYCVVMKARKRL